tara:strand:- start:519 stop:929 length:411 start_codon:yes stop_codon:yes gene_type:complete
MPIIGFNFDKIQAEKTNKHQGNVNIKNNVSVTDIQPDKVALSTSEDVLKFIFEYNINYEPNVGSINLNGHVLFLENKKKVKDILSSWKKEKKIPSPIMQAIINHVLAKCTIKALNLENDVGFPPHINMPKVKSKQA